MYIIDISILDSRKLRLSRKYFSVTFTEKVDSLCSIIIILEVKSILYGVHKARKEKESL